MKLAKQGLIYWPVGTGDSTTVAINDKLYLQIDLHDMEKADDHGDPAHPVIDQLAAGLPKVGGNPYLAVFALTHLDNDHCLGFAELLKRVSIGELWFTSRVLIENPKDLTDDGKAFRKEALRRIGKIVQNRGSVGSGDRIRVVGYHEILRENPYKGLPDTCVSLPGSYVNTLDGNDLSQKFHAFLHAPFKDDVEADPNDTSLAMQIGLANDVGVGHALFFGDLSYVTLKKIFARSKESTLTWNVLLAPHHCSKTAMYVREDSRDVLKQDILDQIGKHKKTKSYIVASSNPIPATNQEGDLPPHAKAKARYVEIKPTAFICTHEYPSERAPSGVVFELTKEGFVLVPASGPLTGKSLGAAVAAARESERPPSQTTGFGKG